jgi:kynurenine formamidase
MQELPRYRDLPRIDPLDARHAWGVFGPNDKLGRVNLLTSEVVVEAARQVTKGKLFNLSLPLNLPSPPWGQFRKPYIHTVEKLGRNFLDDRLDSFFLQGSTQWDGLRHVQAREFGFYGGRKGRETDLAGSLGIDRWAQHGLMGRGVLVDVAAHLARANRPLESRTEYAITVEDIEQTLTSQATSLRQGDIVLLRTGYVDDYMTASEEDRVRMATSDMNCPGLFAGEAMAEFLWDHGVVGIAADNPTVEVNPGVVAHGSLHRRLIALLGFALGEFFDLRALAADCHADGRYTCLLVGVPLNLPGGVGSPGNAIAVK